MPPRLSKWLFPTPLVPPWCLASCPMPPWCLPVKSKPVILYYEGRQDAPARALAAGARDAARATKSRARAPPHDLPRTGPIAIEIVLKVIQNPAPVQNRDSIGIPVLRVSLVPPRLFKWFFRASLVPPWCLAGCPIDPFLPPCKARGVNPRPRGRPKLMTSVICQGETRGVNPK